MNKKILLFGILGLFAVALVTAGVLTYYGQIHQDIDVTQPISVEGVVVLSIDGVAGQDSFLGDAIKISNSADFPVNVLVTDNADEGINVNYVGVLELTTKDGTWDNTNDKKVTVEYTLVGDVFKYKIIEGEGDLDIGDYALIYYKDDPTSVDDADRMGTLGTVYVINENIGSLPYSDDWNAQELANYCDNGYDTYEHCKGAKLWLVPSANAVNGLVDWANWDKFLYETDLIYYFANANGEITVPANSFIEFYPEYTLASDLETGTYTITTSVEPIVTA